MNQTLIRYWNAKLDDRYLQDHVATTMILETIKALKRLNRIENQKRVQTQAEVIAEVRRQLTGSPAA